MPDQRIDGASAERPKAFLVDDNVGLRSMLRELLDEAGVDVVGEADNGTAAVRYIPAAAGPGGLVVLMDIRMPGPVNGIEATRLLVDRCERLAVIVFTAFPGSGIEQAAIDAGAVDVLIKGTPAESIVDAVRRAWSRMVAVAT